MGSYENWVSFLRALGVQLVLIWHGGFLQRLHDHAQQDGDRHRGANQSFDVVGCALKDNTARFNQTVTLQVMRITEISSYPDDVVLPTNMMTPYFLVSATDDARGSCRPLARLHCLAPTE